MRQAKEVRMRKPAVFIGIAAAAVLLAVSLVPLADAGTARRDSAAATIVKVKAGAPSAFAFKLSTKTLGRPGKATFVVTNVGRLAHDFKIAGKKTPLIQPGKTARLVVTFKKKGRYPYLCTVPGHAAAGMKGVFTVK
jgi:uncharacterized cupredoxin-like copper-binding protein